VAILTTNSIFENISNGDILFLSYEDVKNSMPSDKKIIKLINQVFKLYGKNKTMMSEKSILELKNNINGRMVALPSFIRKSNSLAGLKWASSYSDNSFANLPAVNALIVLNQPNTGLPKIIMEGTSITAKRTGAATAAGLYNIIPDKDSISTLAIIGASVQGVQQALMIYHSFDVDKIFVYDLDISTSKKFKSKLKDIINSEIIICDSFYNTTINADIIVTATRCKEPFLTSDLCSTSKAVVSIGATPELKYSVIEKASYIIADNISAVSHLGSLQPYFESGHITSKDIFSEIGDLATGNKKIKKSNESSYILYVPIGMGIEDLIVAEEIAFNAINNQKGTIIKKAIFEPEEVL